MRLMQSGPELNKAGEPVSKFVAESDDLDALKARGYEIADDLDSADALWLWGPVSTWHSLEVIPERCYLAIRP
jgi:hypothetical protein